MGFSLRIGIAIYPFVTYTYILSTSVFETYQLLKNTGILIENSCHMAFILIRVLGRMLPAILPQFIFSQRKDLEIHF